jgi:hypothetical protein
MISALLNTIGLIIDILGAILIFKFGLPEHVDRDGHNYLILEQCDEEEKQKAKKYDFWGNKGLVLLIIGFVFQVISNFFYKI